MENKETEELLEENVLIDLARDAGVELESIMSLGSVIHRS